MHRLTKHKELLGTVSIIIATLCWGFSGCSGQYLLHDLALPTPVVLCIRQISAGIILILLDLIFRKKIPNRIRILPSGSPGKIR